MYVTRKRDTFGARALPPIDRRPAQRPPAAARRSARGGGPNIGWPSWDDVANVALDVVAAPILAPVSIATGKRPSTLIRGGAEQVQEAASAGGDTLKSILKSGGQLLGKGLLATGGGLLGGQQQAAAPPPPQPFNYTPWLLGGGAALALLLIATRKKHH